jgi:hypothetical protein
MVEELKEHYQLYLEWSKIVYNGDVAQLEGALFYGPALKRAARLNDVDTIKLDFTEQHEIFVAVAGFYVATLSWRGIKYLRDDVISLDNCTLTHNKAGTLKNLTNDNFFVIDCELHEEYIHAKYLTYQAWVLDNDGNPLGLD